MWHELRLFLIALQFLTRIPVPSAVGWRADWMHDSARHFPGVGLLLGGFAALVFWLAAHVWPALVSVLLAMAATAWITGAFHEDGLADTFDALGGSADRERALVIMKDSRLGTYGVIALLLVLSLKAAALHGLAVRDLAATLVALPLAHGWSRLSSVALLATMPYGGDVEHAKAKPMAQRLDGFGLSVALLWCVLVGAGAAWFIAPTALAFAALATALVSMLTGRWLMRRLGGFTGDGLGAVQQLSEVTIYLVVLASMGRG